jgi:nucleoside-diphosphate-sugar epimerase
MKQFVTGANGFVGAALCRKLAARGDEVYGLVRKTSDLSLLENANIQTVVGSLEAPEPLAEQLKGVKTLYHIAGAVSDWGPLSYFRRINVEGTSRLLDMAIAQGVSRFVYVSSAAVHSFTGARDMDENSPQLPTSFPYCQSKREAEAVVMEGHKSGGIECVIIRPGDVYGPGDRVSLLPMAHHLERGKLGYIGGGRFLGAFTYVENLADGLILAGTKPDASGEIFVITDGSAHTWRDYFELLCRELNIKPPPYSIPPWLVHTLAWTLESVYRLLRIRSRPPVTRYLAAHLTHDYHFSIEKASRILGYSPAISFENAVRATADWYKAYKKGKYTQ